ncbi:MAG: branched-chain amino acid transaminase [Bryobacteraceae bacterium]|nr:branched-chain amino acid transaminase [Bryobacteraceae bacterium]MDW8380002.1 branched-chain amino acid transaminase [Bryobacterales bacterium]
MMAQDNPIVFFNDRFVPLSEAKISILTHALHYGTGVFEGIRGYWSEKRKQMLLFRAADHFRRWKLNCGLLHMDLAHTESELCDITEELVRRNDFCTDIYIRPIAYRSSPRVGVRPDDQYAIAIIGIPFGPYLSSASGIHACVSTWRRVEDNAIPARGKICGAYVNSALATDEAHRNGFDEAIFLNEAGHVVEGATCNLFLVKQGKLITPPASDNILEGITRDTVMQLAARELRMETIERSIDRSELYQCEEAFFTGTAVEIAPITRIDHHPVGLGVVGPISSQLRSVYDSVVRGWREQYDHWLEPVLTPALDRS